jgi:hypothetical protein
MNARRRWQARLTRCVLIVVQLDAPPARAKTVYGALQAVIPKGYASKGIWMGFGMSVSGTGGVSPIAADHNRHECARPAKTPPHNAAGSSQ